MSKIRSKNTGIERIVFKSLRKKGIHFQRHYQKVLGRPDIVLPKKKIAIFIDGDFWHGYKFSKIKNRLPKKYWQEKIENNIKRDILNRNRLRKKGWKVLRVWEHEIEKDLGRALGRILKFLNSKN